MPHGGARPGAGRPKGARNKRTEQQAKAIEESGLTPLEFMLSVMRDESNPPDMRIDAAKAAAPYVHPKLTSVQHSGDDDSPVKLVVEWAGSKG